MKVPPPPRRMLAAFSALGAALGIVMMTPLLLQGSLYGGVDQLALLFVLVVYAYGIWAAVLSFKSNPGWQKALALFWLVQIPSISSSLVTFTLYCSAGAWLYFRLGPHGLGTGIAAYLGSGYQWSYMLQKSEIHLGINLVAALLTVWLLVAIRRQPALTSDDTNAA